MEQHQQLEMEQQQQQPKQSSPQQTAYKRVVAENKRLKERVEELERELEILKTFVGIGDKK